MLPALDSYEGTAYASDAPDKNPRVPYLAYLHTEQFPKKQENQELQMDQTVTIIITAALVFYSIGVWAERISSRLKWWHFAFFVLGLIFDTWGTGMMLEMVGRLTLDVHGITGVIAILLMFIHALWAFFVLLRQDEKSLQNFHKFSVAVWLAWLVPYFSPMFFSLAG
jgi:uncharacterized repeat protein (TIGR03987 family)